MKINNKSLALVSSVFAITMASTNPAAACSWFCCGDDEPNSETSRLNVQSNQPPSTLTMEKSSLADQILKDIGQQAQELSLTEERKQRLLELEKEELIKLREKTAQKSKIIEETKKIKATRKEEEKEVATEKDALLKINAELDAEIEALKLNTPVKGPRSSIVSKTEQKDDTPILQGMPTPYPGEEAEKTSVVSETPTAEKIETPRSSSLTPTETLSSIQQQIIDEGKKDKVGKRLWGYLQDDNNLAKKLNQVRTNSYLDSLIEIQSVTHNSFKLTVNGKPIVTTYYY